MVRFLVQIKAARATDWYRVGQKYNVYRFDGRYVVSADYDGGTERPWRFIPCEDVEIIG